MSSHRAVKLSFDLTALEHNFQQVRRLAPTSKIMPVIKANAYGHGMLRVAETLAQADGFAVAQISEAIMLREQGIDKPLTVFQGFDNAEQLERCFSYRLRPAISQFWQLELLEQVSVSEQLDLWLKINTGMGRLGLRAEEVGEAWQRCQAINCINSIGLMTHFANADMVEHTSNIEQIDCFNRLSQSLSGETSVSNSAGIINQFVPEQDWVRPGLMLYGASPLSGVSAKALELKPVMRVEASIIAINQLRRGEHVGYGYEWCCPEDMPVGIVNIGYGDGYPRHAAEGTPVSVNQQLARLIGRVSMDSIAIDLRGVNAHCGDRVELWGPDISVDEVASHAGTIAYELLCQLGCSPA